jgi:hypothetical protein
MDTIDAAEKGKEFVDRQMDDASRKVLKLVMGIVTLAVFIGFAADTIAYYVRQDDLFTWVGVNIIALGAMMLGYYSLRNGAIRYKITAELFIAAGTIIFAAYLYEVVGWILTK